MATIERIVIPLTGLHPDLVGIVVPIQDSGEKPVDVCQIMSELLDDFDFAPLGVVGEVDVEEAVIKMPLAREHRFDFAIPLRRSEDRKNCLRWNHGSHKWEIIAFSRHLRIVGTNLMIIARERSRG